MWVQGPPAAGPAGEESCTPCHGTGDASLIIGVESRVLGPGLTTDLHRAPPILTSEITGSEGNRRRRDRPAFKVRT